MEKKLEDLSLDEFYNFVEWVYPYLFPATQPNIDLAVKRQAEISEANSVKDLWEMYRACKDS